MKILILTVNDATQAKLIISPGFATIKIPGSLSYEEQYELRNKLMKIVDGNRDTKQHLKLFYKVGTPFLFLNKKITAKKKETFLVYKYDNI